MTHPRDLADARMLPREAYADPGLFERDRESVFWRSWLCIAHESELGETGSFAALELFGERLCVVRGDDGLLTGLRDQCLHRGTPLTLGTGGRLGACELRCPYHGLRYDLRGRVIEESSRGFELAERQLPELRIGRWRGFVFVQPSGDGPPLLEWMGGPPPWLERAGLPELRLGRRRVYEVAANWKLCVQNFQESHHFPHVHPGLETATPWERSRSIDFGAAWLGGVMPLSPGRDTVSTRPDREERPFVAAPEDREAVHDALLFPAWLTSLQPDYFLSYRLWPQSPARTRVVADIFFHGEARDANAVYAFWDRTNDEDRAICERQQEGVSAPSYEPGRYAESEDGVYAFDRRVAEIYGARRAPLAGIFGDAFLPLDDLVDEEALCAIDREVTLGLSRTETSQTGGTLKWMGVVAPWCMEDGYRDAMHVIEAFDDDEFRDFVALADDPGVFEVARRREYTFGDETDHPFNAEQMRHLAFRHGVYFPWKVCYHLLENDRWEDKHSGHGKDFDPAATELFPRTIDCIRALPFVEIGRAVIFGLMPNDHAPLHRDTEPGRALNVAQSITIDPRGDKRFYLQNAEDDEPLVIDARVYWFNDMDYHGVLPDPFFRYSIRIDGVFQPAFARDLERRARFNRDRRGPGR